MPSAIVGPTRSENTVVKTSTGGPGGPDHNSAHDFGVPEQPVTPRASKAESTSYDATYSTLPATVGAVGPELAVVVQSGMQTRGEPEHPADPSVLYAATALERCANTKPLATITGLTPPASALQRSCSSRRPGPSVEAVGAADTLRRDGGGTDQTSRFGTDGPLAT